MAVGTALLERVKCGLWISSDNELIEREITDLIDACKIDLKLAGVCSIDENDPLIIRAVNMYCKAFFGNSDKMEVYKKAYDHLKMSLSLSGDYNRS